MFPKLDRTIQLSTKSPSRGSVLLSGYCIYPVLTCNSCSVANLSRNIVGVAPNIALPHPQDGPAGSAGNIVRPQVASTIHGQLLHPQCSIWPPKYSRRMSGATMPKASVHKNG